MTTAAGRLWRSLGEYVGLIVALLLLIAFFGFKSHYFFTVTTFQTIASQIPAAMVIAVGMTLVVMTGGIDLSVGSVLAISGAALGVAITIAHWPLPLAVAVCLMTGLVCGAINGLTVVRWSLPPFIVTLGMLEIARGGAYLVSGSKTVYIGAKIEGLANARPFGISLPFLIALATVIAAQILLSRTAFGRYVVATGSNAEALRLSGIDPRPIRVAAYTICGLLAALAACMDVSRLSSADPNAGSGFELSAIAAVVIGGTSLMGGRGSAVRTFFGVLLIAILGSGLAQIGAQEPTKRVVTGAVIVVAVILDHYRSRARRV